ncbi:hypothetical protein MRX96_037351 [Rhipicephalus microplus]
MATRFIREAGRRGHGRCRVDAPTATSGCRPRLTACTAAGDERGDPLRLVISTRTRCTCSRPRRSIARSAAWPGITWSRWMQVRSSLRGILWDIPAAGGAARLLLAGRRTRREVVSS